MKKNKKFILLIAFWGLLFLIGLAAVIACSIILSKTSNALLWLPIALGIVVLVFGAIFTVYFSVIEYKRKTVRSKSI